MAEIEARLPPGYEALEPFVRAWAITGATNRAKGRDDSSESERAVFFNIAKDLLAPALAELDRKPLALLDDKENCLLTVLLSFAHVALAVEMQGPDEVRHAEQRRHMRITRAPADAAPGHS